MSLIAAVDKEKIRIWNSETFEYAALHGNLDNMKWLFENGCPWIDDTCLAASNNKHLDLLDWMIESGNCRCSGIYH